jgi:hypothetical protein
VGGGPEPSGAVEGRSGSRPAEFELPRLALLTYSTLALLLALALLLQCQRRGVAELRWWLLAYVVVGLLSAKRPKTGPLAAGFLAFLLGWVRTYTGGINLDLGLGLVALGVGIFVLDWSLRAKSGPTVDLAGLLLLGIAAWSLVSLAFSIARIRTFTFAPGFGYRLYQFNAQGFSSDEALVRVVIGGTYTFLWWGLYEYARRMDLRRPVLNGTIFLALAVNFGVLIVQGSFDPFFLHPDDLPLIGRLNGVTSFCYALGGALLVFFLLLPAWGAWRGRYRALTALSLAMLLYSVVASGSRTALFTVVIATVLWGGVRLVQLSRTRRRLAVSFGLVAMLLLPATAITVYMVTPPDLTTPIGRLKEGVERQGLIGHLVATRLVSYPLAFRVIGEYPLSGVGAGLYLAEVSKQHDLLTPNLKIQDPYLISSYAANQFLNVGVELGLPGLLALVGVFACGATSLWRVRGPRWKDLAVSLLALTCALQLGPTFYNSESLVFSWMVVGFAGRGGLVSEKTGDGARVRTFGGKTSASLLVATVAFGLVGHLLSYRSLAVDRQWRRLRWHVGMGMLPPEPGGRWTRPQATFTVNTDAPTVLVRWHAGDESAPTYRAEVRFYVDGVLVERSPGRAGEIRESRLPLPPVSGRKRISVLVRPPFVPADMSEAEDRRHLGIFIHSVKPENPSACQPPSS